jgi:hypothetical protein
MSASWIWGNYSVRYADRNRKRKKRGVRGPRVQGFKIKLKKTGAKRKRPRIPVFWKATKRRETNFSLEPSNPCLPAGRLEPSNPRMKGDMYGR